MLSLVVLFAVALVPINEIYGERALNIDDLLNALETRSKDESRSDSSSSSDTSDDHKTDAVLRGSRLVRFLQQARDSQNNKKLTENKRLSKLYTHLTNLDYGGSRQYPSKNSNLGGDYVDLIDNRKKPLDKFVEYLLSQRNKISYTNDKSAKLKNRDDYLLSLNNKKQPIEEKITKLSDRDYDDDADGTLQDYSRIYVILNPEALTSSQNRKDLSSLVSRLMSKSSSVKQSRITPKQLQYKGFPVKEVYAQRRSRRGRRDSLEGRDSMEDNYKPKRPRNNNRYGGAAGGAGGRTPIPYIRHHGDIYERD